MKAKTIVSMVVAIFIMYGFEISSDQEKEWIVPDAAKNMANPTDASDEENIEIGEEIYMKHCKSCHGKTGLGDGPKSEELDTPSGDFSTDITDQTDGELFYKIKEGRDDMPEFSKKIPDDEDVWLVVDFLRTLAE